MNFTLSLFILEPDMQTTQNRKLTYIFDFFVNNEYLTNGYHSKEEQQQKSEKGKQWQLSAEACPNNWLPKTLKSVILTLLNYIHPW